MMRKLRLFTPALLSLSAGAMYLLAKEDLKRKAEGKANITDAIKTNGKELVTDEEKRNALLEVLKLEVAGVADNISKKAEEVKELVTKSLEETTEKLNNIEEEISCKFEELKDELCEEDKCDCSKIKEIELTEEEIQKVKDTLAEVIEEKPKRGRPRKID